MKYSGCAKAHLHKTHATPTLDGSDLLPQTNPSVEVTDVDEEHRIEAVQTTATFHQWMECFDCRCTPAVVKPTTVSTAPIQHLLQWAIVCVHLNRYLGILQTTRACFRNARLRRQFVAAEIIILLVIASVEKLIVGLESFYDVLTSIEKIGQVVDKKMEDQDGEKPVFKDEMLIELDHVSYEVKNREKFIVQDISLKIEPRSRMLITGESGSGKSSLLRLISGIIEPTAGYIYVNNFSLNSLFLNHYRSKLGMSLSEETPFEGTIRENLIFSNDKFKDDKICEVLEIVGLGQFLKEQSKGLETVIKPEGKQISFTVAKKLILARAIIKEPKLLILEDPLDQFNLEETVRIIDYLTDVSRPWSLIVVSSKKSWKMKCNKIITLENGKIKSIK